MTFPFRLPGVNYYGKGSLVNLTGEISKEKAKKVFIVSDRGVAQAGLVDTVMPLVKAASAETEAFLDVEAEPGFDNIELAAAAFKEYKGDLVIGLGGGSSLDVAKAVAVMAKNEGRMIDYVGVGMVPQGGIACILIPTTSGTGSEVTQNAIFTRQERKHQERDS